MAAVLASGRRHPAPAGGGRPAVRRPLVRHLAILALGLLLALAARPGVAADAFTVTGVQVDASAASATAARDAAVAEGQRRAFRQLLERLTAPADHARLPRPGDRELAALVLGFEVQDERALPSRYIGTLSYSFVPSGIRSMLRLAGIPYVETTSRSVLLVPLFRSPSGGVMLWEADNPWRRAWSERPAGAGLVPVVVPAGTADDAAALTAAQAAAGNPAGFEPLLRRYDAGEAVVAEATLDAGGIALALRRPGIGEPAFTDRVPAGPTESQADLMRRATARVVQALEERWKRELIVAPTAATAGEDAGSLVVRAPLTGANDWLELRRRLAATSFVQSVTVRSLSRREAVLALAFSGDPAQLKLVLAQRQLMLDEGPEGWVLRVGGARTGEAPSDRPAVALRQTGERLATEP